jgi:hypothetical protein
LFNNQAITQRTAEIAQSFAKISLSGLYKLSLTAMVLRTGIEDVPESQRLALIRRFDRMERFWKAVPNTMAVINNGNMIKGSCLKKRFV